MPNPLVSIIEDDARRIVAAVDMKTLACKNILLTGASGLLGINFLACFKEAVRQKYAPFSVTATVFSKPSALFKDFSDFKGAFIMQGDLTDLNFINKLKKFDYIIHAAGYGQPGKFMEDQIKTIKLNTSVTLELFNHLVGDGCFLFISTAEVYSGLDACPYKESHIGTTNPTHPRSCYIEAKRCGEAICNAYRARGVYAYSARVALAYGPGTKPFDRRVLNSFIERGLTQKRIILQDAGLAKRTYCYISDTIEILFNILLHGSQPVYNVGGIYRTTIADLARQIGNYIGVPVEFPKNTKGMKDAPDDVCLDMGLVEKEFNKRNYIALREGLLKTIEWQKALYSSK